MNRIMAVALVTAGFVATPFTAHTQSAPSTRQVPTRPAVKAPAVKPRTAQAVTQLRRTGPFEGVIDCMTDGEFEIIPRTSGGEEMLELVMPFRFGSGQEAGTCTLPDGADAGEFRAEYKLWMTMPKVPIERANFLNGRMRIETDDNIELGKWMSTMLLKRQWFRVEIKQGQQASANNWYVQRVVDGPRS